MDITNEYFELPLKVFYSDKVGTNNYIRDVANQVEAYIIENIEKASTPDEWKEKVYSADVDLTRESYHESIYFSIGFAMMELHERGYKKGTKLVFIPETKYMSFHYTVYVLGEKQ